MKKTIKKQPNFLEWNNNIFVSSMKKIDLNIVLIIILDALFYLLSGYVIVFWLQRVQAKMATFNIPANIIALGPEKAQQLVSEVKTFYYLIIFSFILLLIAVIFLASIFKGIIWAKTTKAKISFALISRFLGLNLIWMGFWFGLIFLISWLVDPSYAPIIMVGAIILGVYFTNTLYTLFMRNQKLLSIIDAVKLNTTKSHLFLLPYIIIFLVLYIIVRLSNFIKFKYATILLGFLVIVYSAIVRYCTSTLVMEIEKI